MFCFPFLTINSVNSEVRTHTYQEQLNVALGKHFTNSETKHQRHQMLKAFRGTVNLKEVSRKENGQRQV